MSQKLLPFLHPAPAQLLHVYRLGFVSVSNVNTARNYFVTRQMTQTVMTSKNLGLFRLISFTNKSLVQVTGKQICATNSTLLMRPISSCSFLVNNQRNERKGLALFKSKSLHNNTHFLTGILTTEPVNLISQRFIRNKTQFRSQHQDQTKETKPTTDSTNSGTEEKDANKVNESEFTPTVPPEKPSLYQRFKQTYKQHGKIFIIVHLCTSAAWFSSLYLAVRSGLDIVPYLEKWNFSEKVISPFRGHGGVGNLALTLLMYKLIVPARYATTLAVTNLVIKYLRKEGKMKEIPQEDRLRSLYQESKENIKMKSKSRMQKFKRKSKASKGSKQNGN